jgi:multisubunit Na+/H+ antiporter MnhC subunit
MKTKILDILAAVVIGLALAALALAYFDVLTK